MAKDFLDLLQKAQPGVQTSPAIGVLEEFVAQTSDFVGKPAKCDLIMGGLVKNGQEYRAVLSCAPLGYAQTLFRVYVSANAVAFHPAGASVEPDVKDLRARLIEFLKEPALIEILLYIKHQVEQLRKHGSMSYSNP